MSAPTSTNYSGRKVDLSIFPSGSDPNVPANSGFSLGGRVISGPLALAQAFSVALLTPLGHYKSDPDFGSTLMADLTERKIQFPSDILHVFALASISVISYFDTYRRNLPLDEQIDDVILDSYTVQGTVIEMSISLTAKSGSNTTFLLPVQWGS